MFWRGGINQRSKIYNSELKKKSTFEPGPFRPKPIKPMDFNERAFNPPSAFSEAKHAFKREHFRPEPDPIDRLIEFTIRRLQGNQMAVETIPQSIGISERNDEGMGGAIELANSAEMNSSSCDSVESSKKSVSQVERLNSNSASVLSLNQ